MRKCGKREENRCYNVVMGVTTVKLSIGNPLKPAKKVEGEFLVDTGATRTTICDKDAMRLGIDYLALEKLCEGMLGIGGTVDTYNLKDIKLIFRQESKKPHEEILEKICVLKHPQLNDHILRIPSILGRDILNKHSLIYDKRQEKVYITDEKTLK